MRLKNWNLLFNLQFVARIRIIEDQKIKLYFDDWSDKTLEYEIKEEYNKALAQVNLLLSITN